MKRILVLAGLLPLFGCGGSAATEPDMPDARGTFTGDWSFAFTVVATGATSDMFCPGRIAITSQAGDRLSGEFSVEAAGDCVAASGNVSGFIAADGKLSLELEVDGSEVAGFESLTGCEYVEGRTGFQGVLAGDELSAVADATFDCRAPNGQIICYAIAMTIQGSRN